MLAARSIIRISATPSSCTTTRRPDIALVRRSADGGSACQAASASTSSGRRCSRNWRFDAAKTSRIARPLSFRRSRRCRREKGRRLLFDPRGDSLNDSNRKARRQLRLHGRDMRVGRFN